MTVMLIPNIPSCYNCGLKGSTIPVPQTIFLKWSFPVGNCRCDGTLPTSVHHRHSAEQITSDFFILGWSLWSMTSKNIGGQRVRAAVNTLRIQRGRRCHHIRLKHSRLKHVQPFRKVALHSAEITGVISWRNSPAPSPWTSTLICHSFLTFLIIYNNNTNWSGSVYKPKRCQQHLSLFHWPSWQPISCSSPSGWTRNVFTHTKTEEKQQVWRLSCTIFVLFGHLTAFSHSV